MRRTAFLDPIWQERARDTLWKPGRPINERRLQADILLADILSRCGAAGVVL